MKKLSYRKYTEEDFDIYFEMASDGDVMKYIFGCAMTKEEAQKKFSSILNLNQDKELGYFLVFDEELNVHIGDCKLVNNKLNLDEFEIGYLLKPNFWRKGYGTIICAHLLQEANRLNSEKVVMAIIDPENIASRKLLEKHNFESYWVGIENDLPTEKLKLKK